MAGRNLFLGTLSLIVGLGAGATAGAGESGGGRRRPNVVVILADDLGYHDLGCQGSRDIPTPHIDDLARRGVRCTNAYAASPVGSPTRAALMTGRYPQRFGYEFNPPRDAPADCGLPPTEPTMAEALKAAGYATGLVGKWHLGRAPGSHPQRRGFDEFFGFLEGAHYYLSDTPAALVPRPKDAWIGDLLRGTDPVREEAYLTDAFTREALAFVDRHRSRPFFLYLAYNAPHTPLEAPESYLKRVSGIAGGDARRATYAAMVVALDDGVGAVLAKLREAGLEEDTLVVFLSDNGGLSGYLSPGSNTPLSGVKTELLEGGIRVPFLVRWPGHLPGGRVYEPPVSVLDVLPTALAAGAVGRSGGPALDGVDLIPFVSGREAGVPHEALLWRDGDDLAIRKGPYKLIQLGKEAPQLYDLSTDVGETRDLAVRRPEVVGKLREELSRWTSKLAPPAWGRPIATPWW